MVAESIEYDGPLEVDTALESIDEWDSLGWLGLIALLDEHNIELDLSKLADIENVNELHELIFERENLND